jgi:hypothetical protein
MIHGIAGLVLMLAAAGGEGQEAARPPGPTPSPAPDWLIDLVLGEARARRADVPRPARCRGFDTGPNGAPPERTPYPRIGNPWPVDVLKAQIVKDPSRSHRLYMSSLSADEVRTRLALYLVVSRDEWLTGYSHVGISDEGGWVRTPTECFQWIVRPGGLAIVGYPDGTAVYLAGCRADHWIWR